MSLRQLIFGPSIGALLGLALACSSGQTGTPSAPSPAPVVITGLWVGKTEQAGTTTPSTNVATGYFSASATANRVTTVTVQVSFPAPCRGELTATFGLGAVVANDGTFATVSSSPASTVSISGHFSIDGSAAGSISVTYGSTVGCESTVATTWSASRVS